MSGWRFVRARDSVGILQDMMQRIRRAKDSPPFDVPIMLRERILENISGRRVRYTVEWNTDPPKGAWLDEERASYFEVTDNGAMTLDRGPVLPFELMIELPDVYRRLRVHLARRSAR